MEHPEHLRNKIDVFHQPEIKYTYIENYTLTKVKKKKIRKNICNIWDRKKKNATYTVQRESSIDRYTLPCVKVILAGSRSIAQGAQFGAL